LESLIPSSDISAVTDAEPSTVVSESTVLSTVTLPDGRIRVSTQTVYSTVVKISVVTLKGALSTAPSASASSRPSPTKSNINLIIGATVGVLLGILLLCVAAVLLWRRQRQKRRQMQGSVGDVTKYSADKAQLHSDSIKPIRLELQGDEPGIKKNSTTDRAELPASEMIGAEMEASI
jgi:hypothetical protein